MRLQPRQELLSVWKAISKWCGPVQSFNWADRGGSNSISDAELLLCLLLPPQKLPAIRFDRPDETKTDVCLALAAFGGPVEIPQRIVGLIGQYLTRYSDPKTQLPIFAGGNYLTTAPDDDTEPTPEQFELEVVDAFSTSIVFCTAVIRFLRSYRPQVQRKVHLEEIARVEEDTQRRLTAAMAGLQRSFTISIFEPDDLEHRVLRETVYPGSNFSGDLVARIRSSLRDVMAGLRELGIAGEQVEDLLQNREKLFECGWSWGVVQGSDEVKTASAVYGQPGYAESFPYLYFTVVAVDGIRDLFSQETRLMGLLNEDQQQLARVLNLQWDLAQRYWSTIATMGDQRWPVEELPWRTTDDQESDYYSLLVVSLVRHSLADRGAPDADLARVTRVLEDLADRGRIRRRPLSNDPALTLHQPGRWVNLVGADQISPGAPRIGWRLGELSSLLLGRSLALAAQVNDHRERARLLRLSDETWRHLERRRLRDGKGAGLWDDPANVYPTLPHRDRPSWYHTTRVVQCMGTAADLIQGEPPPGSMLSDMASELLIEAEDVFDEEQLRGSGEGGPALRDSLNRQSIGLRRARQMMPTRPGTAASILLEVLRDLDKLAAAREFEAGD
ncbi:SCO2524 family protein [Actinoplanes sp. HUAS TT8]|uniref:SCO2524 family protein n=1 Tax=Actinoplanes sp. HUAS TT8 TaxID=3447453 RepID=UPI003F522A4B